MGLLFANLLIPVLTAAGGALGTYLWLRRDAQETALTAMSAAQEQAALRHGLGERLAALESALRALGVPQPQTSDLSPVLAAIEPLHARLSAIEEAQSAVLKRLGELESAVRTLRVPPADLDPLLHRLDALGQRLPRPRQRTVAVREGSRNLLTHAGHGKADDLTRIKGVPRVLQRALNKVGVFYFWQIAEWSAEDARYVERQLAGFDEDLGGRIVHDAWVAEARQLAGAPNSAHRPVRH